MQSSSVTFTVPDFTSDGIQYTEILVVIEMDGDLRDAVKLVDTLRRPVAGRE